MQIDIVVVRARYDKHIRFESLYNLQGIYHSLMRNDEPLFADFVD